MLFSDPMFSCSDRYAASATQMIHQLIHFSSYKALGRVMFCFWALATFLCENYLYGGISCCFSAVLYHCSRLI